MNTPLRTACYGALIALAALTAPPAAAQPTGRAGMVGTAPVAGNALTDDTILHVFITSNRGEIVTSQPLLDDFASADVRAFAQELVTMHGGVIERAMALAEGTDMTPRENLVSSAMTMQAQGIADQLDDLPEGPEVDRMYLEKQMVLHGNTLAMLDHVLIPNAEDDALEALLRESRATVEEHLRRVMALHYQMMPAGR